MARTAHPNRCAEEVPRCFRRGPRETAVESPTRAAALDRVAPDPGGVLNRSATRPRSCHDSSLHPLDPKAKESGLHRTRGGSRPSDARAWCWHLRSRTLDRGRSGRSAVEVRAPRWLRRRPTTGMPLVVVAALEGSMDRVTRLERRERLCEYGAGSRSRSSVSNASMSRCTPMRGPVAPRFAFSIRVDRARHLRRRRRRRSWMTDGSSS